MILARMNYAQTEAPLTSPLPLRFRGDGRRRMDALARHTLAGTKPMRVTRAQACSIVQRFEDARMSNHSGQGGTLWVILEYCEHRLISFEVSGEEGIGYFVSTLDRMLDPQSNPT